ncbi:MAG: hypothetical protein DI539_26980, partial [Flavobacterium psychrophilum]
EYWSNLVNEKESIHQFSVEELLARGYSVEFINRENFVAAEGRLAGRDLFDARFFTYTPTEVSFLNPIHRLFHECAWEALEDAGVNLQKAKELMGVFGSASVNNAWQLSALVRNRMHLIDSLTMDKLACKESIATLLSYKLDLKGTTQFIDATCASSIVSINTACKHLLLGEIDVAIVGSVTVEHRDHAGYLFEEYSLWSSDGHCRSFDKDAQGTVPSEGVGVVILKRLKDAQRDRDHIYCVIKGGASNNDGQRKIGYAATSLQGQTDCIIRSLKFARVGPERIGYMEAHGTATKLGDLVEFNALKNAFKDVPRNNCALGSVKTNIGHTRSTSGMAGFIKVALSLKNHIIPASLNYRTPSPELGIEESPFFVNAKTRKWERMEGIPLCAAVNVFGVGGTNAHVILEEYATTSTREAPEEATYKILPLSAKTPFSLLKYVTKLKDFLLHEPRTDLEDLAYTLQVGREEFIFRAAFVFKDADELIDRLSELEKNEGNIIKSYGYQENQVFIFPEMDIQCIQAGHDLYKNIMPFKEAIENGIYLLKWITGQNYLCYFLEESFPPPEVVAEVSFVTQYALAKTLIYFGIRPAQMIGYGLGEITCACISGVLDLENGLRLVLLKKSGIDNVTKVEYTANLSFNFPQLPFISNESARPITPSQAITAEYWNKISKSEDSFCEGVWYLHNKNCHYTYIVLGSLRNLTNLLPQDMHTVFLLAEGGDYHVHFMNTLAYFWKYGMPLQWDLLNKDKNVHKIPLPTYAFDQSLFSTEASFLSTLSRL